jgi:hypothetical protein
MNTRPDHINMQSVTVTVLTRQNEKGETVPYLTVDPDPLRIPAGDQCWLNFDLSKEASDQGWRFPMSSESDFCGIRILKNDGTFWLPQCWGDRTYFLDRNDQKHQYAYDVTLLNPSSPYSPLKLDPNIINRSDG